ncbi:hypothetical protein UO65_5651 [Actinokineospora spheciospongiae]|uniref:Uncharacterized protein n=1 Tax=Actinokineospora spheciospongiae TaxID=909613 RepID=W7IYK3_9PSEU|nr:hypothetical protein UO65_5651 [Actinokineospora spheciospongiae]
MGGREHRTGAAPAGGRWLCVLACRTPLTRRTTTAHRALNARGVPRRDVTRRGV